MVDIEKYKKTIHAALTVLEFACLGLAVVLLYEMWGYRAGWHDALASAQCAPVVTNWSLWVKP